MLMPKVSINGQKEKENVELPESLTLYVPIYIDTASLIIEVDLIVHAIDTRILVTCSSSKLELCRIEAFEEMVSELSKIDDIIVGFGKPEYEEWRYIQSR